MRNEVFARAVSGIDDDLIEEALSGRPVTRRRNTWMGALAAACLVLLISAALAVHSGNGLTVTALGSAVGDTPIAVEAADVSPAQSRDASDILSVPLEITGKGRLALYTSDGSVAVTDPNTDELLYSGQSYETESPVLVRWSVTQPDTRQDYRLILNADTTLLLSYDEAGGHWLLQRQQINKGYAD